MRRLLPLVLATVALSECASATMIESGQKFAVILSILSILISLPAFVSLYIHIRRTNLGKILFQPLLAMFVGFVGIMINSLIQIWQVFNGYEVSNRDLLIGINSAISTLLIAAGAVMMFFAVKSKGLLPIEYYQKKLLVPAAVVEHEETTEPTVSTAPKTAVPLRKARKKR